MHMTIEQIESAALQLPIEDRARLAERLIGSLDGETEMERAWIEEAERRYEACEAGRIKVIPADDVIAKLESRLL